MKVFSELPLLDLLRRTPVCSAAPEATSLAVADLKLATFYLDSGLDFYRISEHSTFDLVEE